jgi:hypothetical protein
MSRSMDGHFVDSLWAAQRTRTVTVGE